MENYAIGQRFGVEHGRSYGGQFNPSVGPAGEFIVRTWVAPRAAFQPQFLAGPTLYQPNGLDQEQDYPAQPQTFHSVLASENPIQDFQPPRPPSQPAYGGFQQSIPNFGADGRYPAYGSLQQFSQREGTLDGTPVTPYTSFQQDRYTTEVLSRLSQNAAGNVVEQARNANPREFQALQQNEGRLQDYLNTQQQQGQRFSKADINRLRAQGIEQLYEDGQVGQGIGQANRENLELVEAYQRANANLHMKYGAEPDPGLNPQAYRESPFNPAREQSQGPQRAPYLASPQTTLPVQNAPKETGKPDSQPADGDPKAKDPKAAPATKDSKGAPSTKEHHSPPASKDPKGAPDAKDSKGTPAAKDHKPAEKPYDPNADSNALYKSMHGGLFGIGHDSDTLFKALEGKTPEQINAIRANYKEHYGKDLDGDLKSKLSGTFGGDTAELDRANALLKGTKGTKTADTAAASADAAGIRNAFGFFKNDNKGIENLLKGKSPDEIKKIAEEYRHQTGHELKTDLADKMSGADKEEALALAKQADLASMKAGREKEEAAAKLKAQADAAEIKGADHWYGGADANAIAKTLEGKSAAERKAIADAYKAQDPDHVDLEAHLKAKLGDHGSKYDEAEGALQGDKAKVSAAHIKESQGFISWFTDKKAIEGELEGKSDAERQAIAKEYDKYGDLQHDLHSTSKLARSEALLEKGQLSAAEDLKFALEQKDKDQLKSILGGRSKDEIAAIRSEYEKSNGGKKLDDAIAEQLSGRDLFQAQQNLKGNPTSLDEAVERANEAHKFERDGGFGSSVVDLFSDKGERFDADVDKINATHRRMQDLRAAGRLDDAAAEEVQLKKLVGFSSADVENYQDAKDSAANTAGTVAATAAGLTVCAISGGLGAPLVVGALLATGAGAVAKVYTAGAIEGQDYTHEQRATDALTGAIDGGVSVLGGVGGKAATEAGELVAVQAAERSAGQIVLDSTIQGAKTGAMMGAAGSGANTVVREETWEHGFGEGLERTASATAIGAGTGAVAGGVIGGGIAGVKQLLTARASQAATQAATEATTQGETAAAVAPQPAPVAPPVEGAPTATGAPGPTATGTPGPTATGTPGPTATGTPEPTVTGTPGPTATGTPGPTATGAPEPSVTGTPEPTVTGTPGPTATGTPEPTVTGTPGPTATGTPEPTVTGTPGPTATGTPGPTATGTPGPTATGTPGPTATGTPGPTATGTPGPTATGPTATGTPGPTATGTPGSTATGTPAAEGGPTGLRGRLASFRDKASNYFFDGGDGVPAAQRDPLELGGAKTPAADAGDKLVRFRLRPNEAQRQWLGEWKDKVMGRFGSGGNAAAVEGGEAGAQPTAAAAEGGGAAATSPATGLRGRLASFRDKASNYLFDGGDGGPAAQRDPLELGGAKVPEADAGDKLVRFRLRPNEAQRQWLGEWKNKVMGRFGSGNAAAEGGEAGVQPAAAAVQSGEAGVQPTVAAAESEAAAQRTATVVQGEGAVVKPTPTAVEGGEPTGLRGRLASLREKASDYFFDGGDGVSAAQRDPLELGGAKIPEADAGDKLVKFRLRPNEAQRQWLGEWKDKLVSRFGSSADAGAADGAETATGAAPVKAKTNWKELMGLKSPDGEKVGLFSFNSTQKRYWSNLWSGGKTAGGSSTAEAAATNSAAEVAPVARTVTAAEPAPTLSAAQFKAAAGQASEGHWAQVQDPALLKAAGFSTEDLAALDSRAAARTEAMGLGEQTTPEMRQEWNSMNHSAEMQLVAEKRATALAQVGSAASEYSQIATRISNGTATDVEKMAASRHWADLNNPETLKAAGVSWEDSFTADRDAFLSAKQAVGDQVGTPAFEQGQRLARAQQLGKLAQERYGPTLKLQEAGRGYWNSRLDFLAEPTEQNAATAAASEVGAAAGTSASRAVPTQAEVVNLFEKIQLPEPGTRPSDMWLNTGYFDGPGLSAYKAGVESKLAAYGGMPSLATAAQNIEFAADRLPAVAKVNEAALTYAGLNRLPTLTTEQQTQAAAALQTLNDQGALKAAGILPKMDVAPLEQSAMEAAAKRLGLPTDETSVAGYLQNPSANPDLQRAYQLHRAEGLSVLSNQRMQALGELQTSSHDFMVKSKSFYDAQVGVGQRVATEAPGINVGGQQIPPEVMPNTSPTTNPGFWTAAGGMSPDEVAAYEQGVQSKLAANGGSVELARAAQNLEFASAKGTALNNLNTSARTIVDLSQRTAATDADIQAFRAAYQDLSNPASLQAAGISPDDVRMVSQRALQLTVQDRGLQMTDPQVQQLLTDPVFQTSMAVNQAGLLGVMASDRMGALMRIATSSQQYIATR